MARVDSINPASGTGGYCAAKRLDDTQAQIPAMAGSYLTQPNSRPETDGKKKNAS